MYKRQGEYSTITSTTGGSTRDIGNALGAGIGTALQDLVNELQAELGGDGIDVQVSDGASDENRIALGAPYNATATGLGLLNSGVGTRADALSALDSLDGAIDQVNKMRSGIGESTNRLQSALNLEMTATENTEV